MRGGVAQRSGRSVAPRRMLEISLHDRADSLMNALAWEGIGFRNRSDPKGSSRSIEIVHFII